jgi:AAA domain
MKKDWFYARQTPEVLAGFVKIAIDDIREGSTDDDIRRRMAPLYNNNPNDTRIRAVIDEARRQSGIPDPDSPVALAAAAISATPYVWKDPETIPQREWLYGHRLIRKFVSATVAQGGIGKSQLEIAEMLAMVSGKGLLGVRPLERLRVWYWNLEDPRVETERRIQATAKHYNLKPDDLDGRLFFDCGREKALVIAETLPHSKGAVILRPVVDALITEVFARKIDVLIIDPFVSCHRVAENDNNAIDVVVKEWGRVADAANCAVELVHHIRKGEQEVTAESARGGSAFIDAARVVRTVNRMTEDQAKKVVSITTACISAATPTRPTWPRRPKSRTGTSWCRSISAMTHSAPP